MRWASINYIYKELFTTSQKVFTIADAKIGGLPGENPVLLVGSIFYLGDKLLTGDNRVFDKEKASELINEAISIAENYNLGFGLDVILPQEDYVEKILEFVSNYNIPLFLDSPDPKTRIKAYVLAGELGVIDKVVANGIDIYTSSEELEAIKNSGIKTAVLFAFDPSNPFSSLKPKDRLGIVEKLLHLIRKAGVENMIVDAIVLDPGSIALSAETIFLVKKELGLPAGCAPANALGPVNKKNFDVNEVIGIQSGIAAMLRVYGADVIMYGPVKRIKHVAPALATVDGMLGYLARQEGVRINRKHPIKSLLKKIQQLFAQQK